MRALAPPIHIQTAKGRSGPSKSAKKMGRALAHDSGPDACKGMGKLEQWQKRREHEQNFQVWGERRQITWQGSLE